MVELAVNFPRLAFAVAVLILTELFVVLDSIDAADLVAAHVVALVVVVFVAHLAVD